MVLAMNIIDLSHISRNLNRRLKKMLTPLLKDGIGDTMDKGNLLIVPGFTILTFAILWTIKLSKLALNEPACRGFSNSNPFGSTVEEEAQRYCQTANRYFVEINESCFYHWSWCEQRQVKNPDWILWFWAPIVFVMYVLTRCLWNLLMETQGINFNNVVIASQSVLKSNDGVTEVDEEKLYERVRVIDDNLKCYHVSSSNAFAAFIAFEAMLVLAPLFLLLFILPIMIGESYRTWGLDVAQTWWEGKEWQGSPLTPFFGSPNDTSIMPLIPRITYCDYHFVTLGNDHVLPCRCYLDANWYEGIALFTWIMLVFLAFINFCNLFFWVGWAIQMKNCRKRQKWVMKKWMNGDNYSSNEQEFVEKFVGQLKMENLLLFYYIEAHTDRVVTRTFTDALYQNWMEKQRQQIQNSFIMNFQKNISKATAPPLTADAEKLMQEKYSTV